MSSFVYLSLFVLTPSFISYPNIFRQVRRDGFPNSVTFGEKLFSSGEQRDGDVPSHSEDMLRIDKTGKRTLVTFSGQCLLPKEGAQIAENASELVQEGQSGDEQCQAQYLVREQESNQWQQQEQQDGEERGDQVCPEDVCSC